MQMKLPLNTPTSIDHSRTNRVDHNRLNRLDPADRRFHDWYRFNLSFPPHLVREYLSDFDITEKKTILDPFCGTGTTLLEAKLNRIQSIGIEANPFAQFASSVKVKWHVDPDSMLSAANHIAKKTKTMLLDQGINDTVPSNSKSQARILRKLPPAAEKLLLSNSISPMPIHKALILLENMETFQSKAFYQHLLLGLAKALVFKISNLRFGPEIGVGKAKVDSPVISPWLSEIRTMVDDLTTVRNDEYPQCDVLLGDSRAVNQLVQPNMIDAVITSPPYPNEKDYTRTTRLESVVLGFVSSMAELRSFKKSLVRSNTRSVYKDDDDDRWVSEHVQIQKIAETIENRRIELGKTSGFEKQYHKVTRLYFGGMARHLANLRYVLKKNARLAYVVGDQASYLRVMIRTGTLLAEIAESMGYEVLKIDLFRQRFATATSQQLREEVLILRWPGFRKGGSSNAR